MVGGRIIQDKEDRAVKLMSDMVQAQDVVGETVLVEKEDQDQAEIEVVPDQAEIYVGLDCAGIGGAGQDHADEEQAGQDRGEIEEPGHVLTEK